MRRAGSVEEMLLRPSCERPGDEEQSFDAKKADAVRRCGGLPRLAAWALGLFALGLLLLRAAAFPVDVRHMSARQQAGDVFWVAVCWWRQAEPRRGRLAVSPARKVRLGRLLNATAARACAAQKPYLVMHLKVPKAASSTVFDLAVSLNRKNAFAVNARPMYVDEARRRRSAKQYVRYYAGLRRRTVRTAHGAFVDFASLGAPRPAYVALMREPLQRLKSHYNYLHWGPRSRWAKFWKGHNAHAPPFGDCAAAHRDDALRQARREPGMPWAPAALASPAADAKGGCLYWANVQLAYFCGVRRECRGRGALAGAALYAFGSARALEAARRNLARDFVAVGLVERLEESLAVFERVLPTYFCGVVRAYRRQSVWSRATVAPPTRAAPRPLTRAPEAPRPNATRNATPAQDVDAVDRFVRDEVLHWEYKLYNIVASNFAHQLAHCGL
ncbi:hypothetical protein M885DRAFT_552775 [Pelagophyceae sp. CCMP2097]|nr:hypothetical protein M885DRAFT_552775 [Pelagophyceae sp. CCMP2097]